MQEPDAIAAPGSGERQLLDRIDPERLPRHVAFIMDGNGRWAEARNMRRVEGHRAGIKTVRQTVETCARLGLEAVTLYAFSTENWKRPRHEVLTLMGLLKDYISTDLETFRTHDLRLQPIGRVAGLDATVRRALRRAVEATADNRGMVVQVALNYSGRQELTDLVREVAEAAAGGRLEPSSIDESWISAHLATAGTPDPDLMIRTSGEQRISNFLLWQLAYAEIYFCPVLWPDFSTAHLLEALLEFQLRERRFGGLPSLAGGEDTDGVA
jgi:undecaprenyl diphosphate synthase